MAKISKPDANPVIALLLTWFVFGLGHFLINGQQKKWIMVLVTTIVGSFCCVIPGLIVGVCSIIDSYQTAVKLKSGQEIDENEYTFKPLYTIMKKIHKEAVFNG